MRSLLPALALVAACSASTTPTPTPDAATDIAADIAADTARDAPVDAALDTGAAPADVPCASALPGPYRYGYDGGKVAYTDRLTLTPPRRLEIVRERRDTMSSTCETELYPCNTSDAVDVGEVARALAHPDVEAALAAAGDAGAEGALYGRDERPVDGQVFVLQRGTARVLVGAPCRTGAGACRDIPMGLQQVVDVLRGLAEQELLRPACMALRNG